MLIRTESGGRQKLISINNMTDIETNYGQINIYYKNRCIQLGMYSSPEKAAKVMDMLEEAYKEDNTIVPFYRDYGDLADNSPSYISNRVVFHMPKDEEVKI